MALSLAEAVSNKQSDFLDENSTLSSLARQKLFMITKPGFDFFICRLASAVSNRASGSSDSVSSI